ncbi:MAG: FecR family protein [Cyclobacteriaceae bacterium]
MNDLDYILLSRHFSGETSAQEEEVINRWRISSQEAENTYQELKEAWNLDYQHNHNLNPAAAKAKIDRYVIPKRTLNIRYPSIAASIVLLVATGLFLWLKTYSPTHEWLEKKTISGQKSTITLSDGSTVMLNSNTTFVYPSSFSDTLRKVKLTGEAFFEVVPSQQPFVVEVNAIEVTVLGTSFNIEAYEKQEQITVGVASGKVRVNDQKSSVLLLANQIVHYHKKAQKMSKEEGSVENIIAWKEGWLVFEDTPLSEVINTLNHWYRVSITLENTNLNECLFTGKFKNETLINILDNICFTSKLNYKINDNKFIISGKGCID